MRLHVWVAASVAAPTVAFAQGPLSWHVEHRAYLSPSLPIYVLYEGEHVYGTMSQISNPTAGSWTISSAVVQPPGVDSIRFDFAGIDLEWSSEIDITGMNPRTPLSGVVLRTVSGQEIGKVSGGCGVLHAEFLTSELPPEGPPVVLVLWNHVCYQDCNCDGRSNAADFGCFQTKFVAGDPYADCNEDGRLTVGDFGCFQTRFVLGGCL